MYLSRTSLFYQVSSSRLLSLSETSTALRSENIRFLVQYVRPVLAVKPRLMARLASRIFIWLNDRVFELVIGRSCVRLLMGAVEVSL